VQGQAHLLNLKFGTSGLRGLVSDLRGAPAFNYTLAFAQMLLQRREIAAGDAVFVGRDLRSSSPEIARICAAAIQSAGLDPRDCGALPTPALAAHAMDNGLPAIMVTGSHIPDDRNGLKFYRATGEIDKADEAGIIRLQATVAPDGDADLAPRRPIAADRGALDAYRARYIDFFAPDSLAGLTVGVYQHSTVARDLLMDLLRALGAEAVALGRSETFVPVDTEALRPEDVALARAWARSGKFDAIVSADGDADRPLIADEEGRFVRGDLVGAITANQLGATTVVTPVTSNSALERHGGFERVIRTKVGSPYVIAGMETAGAGKIVGFEANGGFLLGWTVSREGRSLAALPTRDALLPILAVLSRVRTAGQPLSALAADYGFKAVASDRLKNVPPAQSGALLTRLKGDRGYADDFFAGLGGIATLDATDGLRFLLGNGETVHIRASGNAPELRCYVEADGSEKAEARLAWGLAALRRQLDAAVKG
jgi:phosphomannomutase